MPEIAEVARAVYFLREHLVGKTLASVRAVDDPNVFGKAGTSGAEIEEQLAGKKVAGAGQQGKYFWLLMSSPPHLVMHLGMTGWVYLRHTPTAYFRRAKPEDYPLKEWPPKAWRFALTTATTPPVEMAFVDSRRFARVRLVDCAAAAIRDTAPLAANGPDPVLDAATVTREWLRAGVGRRQVPIKALLLDQAFLSGVGNWVGDEVLFHAGIHPEQVAASLGAAKVARLHEALMYVTSTAVKALANGEEQTPDEERFPGHWLFRHRWGKGKKDAPNRMPDGSRITFVTVGGRTSAVVEGKQKLVKRPKKEDQGQEEEAQEEDEAPASDEAVQNGEEEKLPARSKKRKATPDAKTATKKRATGKARKGVAVEDEEDSAAKQDVLSIADGTSNKRSVGKRKQGGDGLPPSKSRKTAASRQQEKSQGKGQIGATKNVSRAAGRGGDAARAKPISSGAKGSRVDADTEAFGRRRSGRLSGRKDA